MGAFEVDVSNWSPFAPKGVKAIFTGATVVFFAYVGFDAVANSAEESKRPQACCIGLMLYGANYHSLCKYTINHALKRQHNSFYDFFQLILFDFSVICH